MKKILFICNQNHNRSKTAENIFSEQFKTQSAGIYNKKISKKQLSWADTIVVMEDKQRTEIAQRFPKEYLQKRILSLEIPDIYNYNDPKLIAELKKKIKKYYHLL